MPNVHEIEKHLEEFAKRYEPQTWYTILGYVKGYYGSIEHEHLIAVFNLQQRGIIG